MYMFLKISRLKMQQKFGSLKLDDAFYVIIIHESPKENYGILWILSKLATWTLKKSGYLISMRSVIIVNFRRNTLAPGRGKLS